MSQSCRVCQHPDRKIIEQKIMSNIPHTKIAKEHEGITNQGIRNHTRLHLSKKLLELQEQGEVQHLRSMNEEIEDLVSKTKTILKDAQDSKKPKLSLRAIDSLRATLAFICQIGAYLHEQQQRDEKKSEREQVDNLKNLSDRELDLLERILRKAETGEGKEITSLDYEDEYERKSKRKSKSKFKRRSKGDVKFDFEDEEINEGEGEELEKQERDSKKVKKPYFTTERRNLTSVDKMCPGAVKEGSVRWSKGKPY